MKLKARVLAELVLSDGVPPIEPDLVKFQVWAQGAAELDDVIGGPRVPLASLMERFLAIAGSSDETPVYVATALTLDQALLARRIFLELGESLQVQWGGWVPDEHLVPKLGLKEQAFLGTLKMFLRKSAA